MRTIIQVVFFDANSGQVIGRSEMPLEQLPESFEANTTVQIGEDSWTIERAEPSAAADFARAGKLELILRKVETVPVNDILYSLPTICDPLPGLDPALDRTQCFVLQEDDWRQREFVSPDQLGAVDEQCAAIRRIYAEHSHQVGDITAFDSIHVRTAPARPITTLLTLDQIMALLPSAIRQYGGVSFRNGSGAIPNSFATAYPGCVLYGSAGSDGVQVLAVHGDDTTIVEPLRMLGLSLVDWISCTVAQR